MNDFTEDSVLKSSSWHTMFVRIAVPSSFTVLIAAIIDSSVHCLSFFFFVGLFGAIGGNRGLPGPFFFPTKLSAIV